MSVTWETKGHWAIPSRSLINGQENARTTYLAVSYSEELQLTCLEVGGLVLTLTNEEAADLKGSL